MPKELTAEWLRNWKVVRSRVIRIKFDRGPEKLQVTKYSCHPLFFNMNEREIEYKTLDEIKLSLIEQIVTMDESNGVGVTRCYETLTGRLIARGPGEDAPPGKYKILN